MKWWDKYKDKPPVLETIARDMIDMSGKIEEEWRQKEWKILRQYGRGGIGGLSPKKKEMFWNLSDQCNRQVRPLWVEIAEIYNYLNSIKHG